MLLAIFEVPEPATHLHMKRQNVGPELRYLAAEGLIEIIDTHAGKDIWGKKPVDRTLRITKFLEQEFNLEHDGLRMKARKGKRKRSVLR